MNFLPMDAEWIRNLAISMIYLILLGTSAIEKWKSLSVPDWFLQQFSKTFLSRSPGMTKLSYWLIALLELALALMFFVSLFQMAFLVPALLGSLFLFAILCFGLRISYDFQGSANMFTYFSATLVCLLIIGGK